MKLNRKRKGQKAESHLELREVEEMCVRSRGTGTEALEETLLVMTKELRWQVCFFPSNSPSGRLDDNFILAKFLCVVHLSFSISFSLTSPISIPLRAASPSLQDPSPPSDSSILSPATRRAGTLARLILSALES